MFNHSSLILNPQTSTEDAALNQLPSLQNVPLHLRTQTASVFIISHLSGSWFIEKYEKNININIEKDDLT